MERLNTRKLAAYLDGEVTTNEAHDIEKQLRTDEESRKRFEKLRAVRGAVKSAFDVPTQSHFADAVTNRISKEKAATISRRTIGLAAATCAVAAALFVVFDKAPEDPSMPGTFFSRGGGSTLLSLEKAAGVQAYLHREGRPDTRDRVREDTIVASGDGLSFRTYNRSGKPIYLMLMGVDALGEIHWFFPAASKDGWDSPSVRIEAAPEISSMPDGVTLDALPKGPLRIVSVFTERPLVMRTVKMAFESGGVQSLRALDANAAVEETVLEAVPSRRASE